EEKRYGSDVLTKRFHGDTLGYVTPWNNHGYNTAKLFRSKFTYIAPVWYQVLHSVLPSVHRLSVNAYDYSTTGPNAPLPWLKATLEALKPFQNNAKFLMGLAFYGYDTNGKLVM
ncbi:hypothetical protein DYB25_010297, partial [Aphanomyces astaci]